MEHKCAHEGCNATNETNYIMCIDGYGFYCEDHYEELFVSCPHCDETTEIPLKHQAQECGWCHKDISESFV